MKPTIPAYFAPLVILVIAVINLTLPATGSGPTARMTLIVANLILLATALSQMYLALFVLRREAQALEAQSAKIRELEVSLTAAEKRAGELSYEKEETVRTLRAQMESELARFRSGGEGARESAIHAGVVHFLGLLQAKGRFIDFLMDDITAYDDKQVGAASRVVHQGCSSVIKEYFDIVPVRDAMEGVPVTVEKDDSPSRYRLVGKVVGHPPFRGTLLHRGWRTRRISLPQILHDTRGSDIIMPAEIELS